MSTTIIAPAKTHELVADYDDDEEDDPTICHLLDNSGTLCGARGIAIPAGELKWPRQSPCESCKRTRCPECAARLFDWET